MHVVLYDSISIGHHPTYLQQFTLSLLKLGHKVSIFFPDIENLRNQIQPYTTEDVSYFKISEETESSSRFLVLNRWRTMRNEIKKSDLNPDLVFLCWADSFRFRKDHALLDKFYLWFVQHFFSYKWSGLYFHPTHLRTKDHPFNQYANYCIDDVFSDPKCLQVAVLDEGIAASLEQVINKPVLFFPDITDVALHSPLSPQAQQIFKAAKGRKIISIVGVLQKRKGVLAMLKAAEQMPDNQFFFVLAGPLVESDFSSEELSYIKQTQATRENLFCLFEKLTDGHSFNSIVRVSDGLYAVYNDFPHSSNIMTKATFFKKPLLVNKGYLMEERIQKFRIGYATDGSSIPDIINGLSIIADLKIADHDFEKYYELHSIEALQNSWEQLLKPMQ